MIAPRVRSYTLADMPQGLDLRRSYAFNRRPGDRNNRGRVAVTSGSSWTPLNNPATKLWFDPSILPDAEGAAVGSLPNLANTAMLAALTATGSQRPTVRQIRGLKALKFVRSSVQRLESALLSGSLAAPLYTFIVHCSGSANTTTTLCSGNPGSGDNYRVRATAATWPRGNAILGSATLTKASTTRCDQPVAVMALHNGASSIIRLNGFSDTTGNAGTVSITGFGLGIDTAAANAYGGTIGEVIVAQGPLTSDEQTQYLSYLENKWHTTAARRQIMPVGDSRVVGAGTTAAQGAWRQGLELWGQSAPSGYYLDFIGPVEMVTWANSNHDGVGGTTIANHTSGGGGATAIGTLLTSEYIPDVLVLNVGINDANVVPNVIATMLSDYAALLAAIRTARAGQKVLACNLNDSSIAATRANINGFNAGLPGVISTENGLGGAVTMLDLNTPLGVNAGSGNFQDSLHPSVAGCAVEQAALQAALPALF